MKQQNNREKRTWICLAVSELALIVFCIAGLLGEKEVYAWSGQDMTVYGGFYDGAGSYRIGEGDAAAGDVCLSMNLPEIPAGVYEVFLEYDAQSEQVSEVTSESLGYRMLLQNAVSLRPSGMQKETSYRFLLKKAADDIKISIIYTGTGNLVITNFRAVHTRQEYSMLLFWVLLLSLLADIAVVLFGAGTKKKIKTGQKQVLFGLLIVLILASGNLMTDFTHLGDDAYFHLNRIEGIAREWMAGHFPARLESYCLYGMGYPTSIMYPDLWLWPAAVLRLIGFDLAFCYKAYIVFVNLLTVGIAYYSFRGIFGSRQAGLFGSAVYTLSLYRLYNIYTRGAVGEFTAMAFLPLICWGLTRVFSSDEKIAGERKTVLLLAFGYMGVLYCHVLSMELAAVFTVIVCLICWKRFFRKAVLLAFGKAALLAAGLSAWYLIPFLDYSIRMKMKVFETGNPIQILGLYPLQLFWIFPWRGDSPYMYATGMQAVRAYGIGLGLLIVFLYFAYRLLSGMGIRPAAGTGSGVINWKNDGDYPKIKAAALVGFFAMLMSMTLFPWDKISGLCAAARKMVYSIQFPYRFLVIVTIALSYLGCGLFVLLKREGNGKKGNLFAAAVVAGTLLSGIFYLNDEMATLPRSDFREAASMGSGAIGNGEYLPDNTDVAALPYTSVSAGDGVVIGQYQKENSHVEFSCRNESGAESYVDCNLLYYIGYHAKDRESGEALPIARGENNVLRVRIPAGYQGNVAVDFTGEAYWKAADWISGVLWLAVIASFYYTAYRRQRKKRFRQNVGGITDNETGRISKKR